MLIDLPAHLADLHKVDDLALIVSATLGELCQPDLLAISRNICQLRGERREGTKGLPLVQHLQSVHHLVSISCVVMSCQVVYPAAQSFTGLG